MQPTNTEVDYEKALQNYFHYDDEEIHQSMLTVYVSIKLRFPKAAQRIHSAVSKITKDVDLTDDFYTNTRSSIEVPFYTYEEDAYIVQEFLHDWNMVTGELDRECACIDAIIEIGKDEDDGTRNHPTRFTMNLDGSVV